MEVLSGAHFIPISINLSVKLVAILFQIETRELKVGVYLLMGQKHLG